MTFYSSSTQAWLLAHLSAKLQATSQVNNLWSGTKHVIVYRHCQYMLGCPSLWLYKGILFLTACRMAMPVWLVWPDEEVSSKGLTTGLPDYALLAMLLESQSRPSYRPSPEVAHVLWMYLHIATDFNTMHYLACLPCPISSIKCVGDGPIPSIKCTGIGHCT